MGILVVLGENDEGTRAIAQSVSEGKPDCLRVLTDHSRPKNKPKALNTALPECRGDIVGVIDAEDEVNPALLHHFEACFRHTGAEVVQCGAQLVSYRPGQVGTAGLNVVMTEATAGHAQDGNLMAAGRITHG